jgi:hypothetical protein
MSDTNNDPHDPSVGSDLGTVSLVLREIPCEAITKAIMGVARQRCEW